MNWLSILIQAWDSLVPIYYRGIKIEKNRVLVWEDCINLLYIIYINCKY